MNLGAHVSIAGGIHTAVDRQHDIGGTCGQLFTTSPRVWRHPDPTSETIRKFLSPAVGHPPEPWIIHASYLVNLATPNPELHERSIAALQADVDVAAQLSIPYVNVHLGAHTGAGETEGLELAVRAIDSLQIPNTVKLLIETDAGAGTKLGETIDQLALVHDVVEHSIGVCLDTAHLFAAGYDISTPSGVDEFADLVDSALGMESVYAVHLNDSRYTCGSNKDHHAHIGEGKIGSKGLAAFINHEKFRDLPFVLETPKSGIGDPGNIERVKSLRDGP